VNAIGILPKHNVEVGPGIRHSTRSAHSGGNLTKDTGVACLAEENIKPKKTLAFNTGPSSENGNHIGCAGIRPYNAARRIFEIGAHLRPEYWRRGLAEEAARAVSEFAFTKVGATALFADHHPKNESSRRPINQVWLQIHA
jgi:[ribosomal protein S5]-alanine N-acetyltransferase